MKLPETVTISEIMFFRLPVCMYNSGSNESVYMKENSGWYRKNLSIYLSLRYKIMMMMMMMIIIIIINQETIKLGKYRKHPYWTLHTYFGKC
jgi:hypothetical protein